MKKLFFVLKTLIKAKYILSNPGKKKILFFDSPNTNLLRQYLNKKNCETLHIRGEIINLKIILCMLLKLNFSFKSYVYNYIKLVNPKVVITFMDNSIFFYKLKKNFPNIKFISIQVGYRMNVGDFFDDLKKINNSKKILSADYIFSYGKAISDKYSKYIEFKSEIIGSFKNNLVPIKKSFKNSGKVLFISQFRMNMISRPDFYVTERKVLPIISKFCEINNLKLFILGTSENFPGEERSFFKNILKKKVFSFIKRKKFPNNYILIDNFDFIICIDSTLGYEALARKKKVAVFSNRKEKEEGEEKKFGWPKNLRKKGFFFSNIISEKEVFRVLKNVYVCNQRKWDKQTKSVLNGVIDYNYKNKKFFQTINKII